MFCKYCYRRRFDRQCTMQTAHHDFSDTVSFLYQYTMIMLLDLVYRESVAFITV